MQARRFGREHPHYVLEYCFARSSTRRSAHDAKSLVGFNGILNWRTRDDLVHHSVLYAIHRR